MTETSDPDGPEQAFDPAQIARDWITVWQSELAALATDREAQEAWQGLVALWANAAGTMLEQAGGSDRAGSDRAGSDRAGNDRANRRARPAETSRSTAAAAAPDPRDAEIERLSERVAELEQRIAELEQRGGRGVRRRAATGRN